MSGPLGNRAAVCGHFRHRTFIRRHVPGHAQATRSRLDVLLSPNLFCLSFYLLNTSFEKCIIDWFCLVSLFFCFFLICSPNAFCEKTVKLVELLW